MSRHVDKINRGLAYVDGYHYARIDRMTWAHHCRFSTESVDKRILKIGQLWLSYGPEYTVSLLERWTNTCGNAGHLFQFLPQTVSVRCNYFTWNLFGKSLRCQRHKVLACVQLLMLSTRTSTRFTNYSLATALATIIVNVIYSLRSTSWCLFMFNLLFCERKVTYGHSKWCLKGWDLI